MVGGGGATTVGVNLLPPLGLRDFSVGNTGALLDEVLGVAGASVSLLPQPAASELTASTAAAQAVSAPRRAKVIRFMVFPWESTNRYFATEVRPTWQCFAGRSEHVMFDQRSATISTENPVC